MTPQRRQEEPNLTPVRFMGGACPKCGFHVRYVKTRSCVWCHKAMINRSKAKKSKIEGHPYREKLLALNRDRAARVRLSAEYRNKEKLKYKEYYDKNYKTQMRDSKILAAREREILEVSRIPAWADRKKIAAIYKEARALGMVVDHVIPLKGRGVCGLHVETNLRIITKLENAEKSNKLIEELL